MKSLAKRATAVIILGLVVGFPLTACGEASPTPTPTPTVTPAPTAMPGVDQTAAQTASYRIELWTGTALMMMMMMMMMMTEFPIMSTMDQGQPVNQHLEIHIFNKSSGAKVTDIIPVVNITNQVTGASRDLADARETGASQGVSFVTACQVSMHREVEPHFGDNIYLPNGSVKRQQKWDTFRA